MEIREQIDKAYLSLIQSALDNAKPNAHLLPPLKLRDVRNTQRPLATCPNDIKICDKTISLREHKIGIRIYRKILQSDENTPIILFFHGGGFVVGNLDTHQESCIRLCYDTSWPVISVDYRLAPENPFPAATEDCYGVLCWLAEQSEYLKIDPARIAVVGESAGGNLAAVTCIMARDRHGPLPKFQLLFYPVTDCNFETPSYVNFSDGPLLTLRQMEAYWRHYLDGEKTTNDPYAAPLQAKSLAQLPSTTIVTAEIDVLRSEAEAYGVRLKAEGVSVTEYQAKGLIHGFMKHVDAHPEAKRTYVAAKDDMIRKLNKD